MLNEFDRTSALKEYLALADEGREWAQQADVAAGHVVRFRRAGADRVVRSREQAHPAIVSVETFTEAQLRRRSRAAGGNRGRAKLERTWTTGTRPYLLRGMAGARCAAGGCRVR